MVKPDLTTQMIDAGRQLLELLDRQQFGARASFWFYFPESDRWRFVVASPQGASPRPSCRVSKGPGDRSEGPERC